MARSHCARNAAPAALALLRHARLARRRSSELCKPVETRHASEQALVALSWAPDPRSPSRAQLVSPPRCPIEASPSSRRPSQRPLALGGEPQAQSALALADRVAKTRSGATRRTFGVVAARPERYSRDALLPRTAPVLGIAARSEASRRRAREAQAEGGAVLARARSERARVVGR